MRVRLLFFGVLREALGGPETTFELTEGSTVAALLRELRERTSNHAMDASLWQRLAVAVNREYASADRILGPDDEVALLPPVSGGNDTRQETSVQENIVALIDHPIPSDEIIAAIKAPPDGAVCIFDGIVRDNTRGRATLHLDYEAYREMALEQMHRLADDAVARFAVRRVAIVHRLGRLDVGETSVLIAVASAHRAAAFDACRWLIDTLKRTVPIWKKETFADGAVWAPGEPFPEEIAVSAGRNEAVAPVSSPVPVSGGPPQ